MQKKVRKKMKSLVAELIWLIRGGYKPREFWDNWAETFMDDPWQVQTHAQHKWLLSKIDVESKKTILEVGCGFGRNIKYMLDQGINPSRITGVDISSAMIKKAKKYIGKNKVSLKTASILNLPFSNNQFNTVFTHGVLMHTKPADVERALKELSRVTNKTIILIEQNYGGNEYTFIHEYKKLLKNVGLNVVEYKASKKLGLDLIYAQIR